MTDSYVKDPEVIYIKDPSARLNYSWDWSDWLAGIDDTISAATVTVAEGLTAVGPPVIDGAFVTQRAEGGILGATHKMVCQITTVGGLIDERTIKLTILDR